MIYTTQIGIPGNEEIVSLKCENAKFREKKTFSQFLHNFSICVFFKICIPEIFDSFSRKFWFCGNPKHKTLFINIIRNFVP